MSGSETGISSCDWLKLWRGSSTLELVSMKLHTIISFTSKINLPSQYKIFPEQSICIRTLKQIIVLVEPNELSVSSLKPTNVPYPHPAEIVKIYFCNNYHNISILVLSQSSSCSIIQNVQETYSVPPKHVLPNLLPTLVGEKHNSWHFLPHQVICILS